MAFAKQATRGMNPKYLQAYVKAWLKGGPGPGNMNQKQTDAYFLVAVSNVGPDLSAMTSKPEQLAPPLGPLWKSL